MKILLLFVSALQVVHGSCPDGFDLVRNGQCRGKVTTTDEDTSVVVNRAVSDCKTFDAVPVTIHDAEDEAYWVTRVWQYKFVLGLVCNSSSLKWQWVDGSPVDYKPASYDYALDQKCTSYKNYGWALSSNSQWHMWEGNIGVDIFCSKQLQQPILAPGGCYGFGIDLDDGLCYQIAAADNWTDAQQVCANLGANVASIHNESDNSFLWQTAIDKQAVSGIFLGATRSGKGGSEFGWVDGSKWDYDKWITPAFPMKTGDCLAMDTTATDTSGKWMNIDCSTSIPVACMRQHVNDTAPKCAADPYDQEGTLITSPGFPFSASMYCDIYLMVDEGKQIEAEIISLEANSCCDFLVIHEGTLGGKMLANLTGAIQNKNVTGASNIMRVSWQPAQPDGGVNVKGLLMTFRAV